MQLVMVQILYLCLLVDDLILSLYKILFLVHLILHSGLQLQVMITRLVSFILVLMMMCIAWQPAHVKT